MKAPNSNRCPAPGTAYRTPAQLAAAAPVVNMYLTGCNINAGRDLYTAPADLCQMQAETIRAQAATIAAQQRTIDRLLSIIEGMTAAGA